MSSNNTERREDIQLAEVTTLKNRQACTSRAETEVVTFKNAMGVTEDKELLDAIMKEENISKRGASIDGMTKIQKVSGNMLWNDDFRTNFKPRELSIGPIHAADSNLFKKELKLKLAAHFFKNCSSKKGDGLLEQIKTEIKDIKTRFNDEVIKSYTDDELIRLLFLDGCAMLGFIHCFVNRQLNELSISNGQAGLIQQDLFLLENQIPFKVLALLMGIDDSRPIYCRPIDKSQKYFFKFIVANNMINFPSNLKDLKRQFKKIDRDRNPDHVLDLLRDVITAGGVSTFNCLSFIKLLLAIFCSCGLVIPLMICKCVCSKVRRENPEKWSKKQSFRNVQELKTAGIKFKQNDTTLREISFYSRFFVTGRLNLPTLVVNNSTKCMLLNLVAYEMCFSGSHPNQVPWITSYVNLLDLLIDNEQDVKDLRAANVLRNCLSSDAEVANVVNSMASSCFAPSKDTYANVKKKIQKHYRRKLAIWIAEFCHTHFRSPWTILALFAAMAALVLTAIQTWCCLKDQKSKRDT